MATAEVTRLRRIASAYARQKEADDQEAIEALNRTWNEMSFGEEADLFDEPLDDERNESAG